MKRKGFSMVEVVISIALIVILIGMTYSAITISMTQTNTNELKRLALHEIQNLQDVFRCEALDEAVNLYLKETAEVDSEFQAWYYAEPTLSYSSQLDQCYVTALILYYNKSGGLIGFRSIADRYSSVSYEGEKTLEDSAFESSAGQTEDEAFTITITVDNDKYFTEKDAKFSFKSEIKGGKTVYNDSVLTDENKTRLTGLANTEIGKLRPVVNGNKGSGLANALNNYFGKTSSDEKFHMAYGIVETVESSTSKMFYLTKLTLYYNDSGELIGFETLAERRLSFNYEQPESAETDRQARGQTTDWAFAITITVDDGQLFINENANFYFKAELTGGATVYEDKKSTESSNNG